MKTLHQHAIEFYGLELDEEQNTYRWRAMEPHVKIMEDFLNKVVEDQAPRISHNFIHSYANLNGD